MIEQTFTLINYYEDDTVFLFLGHSIFSARIILRASFTSSASSSSSTFDNDAAAVAAAAAAAAATAAVATASFFWRCHHLDDKAHDEVVMSSSFVEQQENVPLSEVYAVKKLSKTQFAEKYGQDCRSSPNEKSRAADGESHVEGTPGGSSGRERDGGRGEGGGGRGRGRGRGAKRARGRGKRGGSRGHGRGSTGGGGLPKQNNSTSLSSHSLLAVVESQNAVLEEAIPISSAPKTGGRLCESGKEVGHSSQEGSHPIPTGTRVVQMAKRRFKYPKTGAASKDQTRYAYESSDSESSGDGNSHVNSKAKTIKSPRTTSSAVPPPPPPPPPNDAASSSSTSQTRKRKRTRTRETPAEAAKQFLDLEVRRHCHRSRFVRWR